MSRKYRYQFTKDTFPGYIVFLVVKRKYITYDNDLEILKYIKYKDKLSLLDKYKINYLVLDNLDIIIQKKFEDNNYYKYLYLTKLDKVINKSNLLYETKVS